MFVLQLHLTMTLGRLRRIAAACWQAVTPAVAACVLAPERAFAESVIDAAAKPYFVLGGSVTALVFLGLGLLIFWPAIRERRMAVEAMQWPVTDGRIISAEVIKRVSKSQDEFNSFVPRVRYEYITDGVRRQSDIIRIGLGDMGYLLEKQAREHLARYPVGATVSVRYDPEAPERAVLETGHVGVTRKLFAGFIFFGLGIAGIIFAIWSAGLPTQ